LGWCGGRLQSGPKRRSTGIVSQREPDRWVRLPAGRFLNVYSWSRTVGHDGPNVPCGVKATEPRRSACHCGELGNSRGKSGFLQRGGRTRGDVSDGDRPELERPAACICVTMRSWKRSIGRVHAVGNHAFLFRSDMRVGRACIRGRWWQCRLGSFARGLGRCNSCMAMGLVPTLNRA
jgi:hypothetical protein